MNIYTSKTESGIKKRIHTVCGSSWKRGRREETRRRVQTKVIPVANRSRLYKHTHTHTHTHMICVEYRQCCRRDHHRRCFLLGLSYHYCRYVLLLLLLYTSSCEIYTHTRVNEGTFMSARYTHRWPCNNDKALARIRRRSPEASVHIKMGL